VVVGPEELVGLGRSERGDGSGVGEAEQPVENRRCERTYDRAPELRAKRSRQATAPGGREDSQRSSRSGRGVSSAQRGLL
jgi:hypothetical protein